ncbi:MAG TPA: sigma-70 family RNA polymerase sigma factor [Bryobacteraceae bacterium]|nr:sigma-70 family RNA polymerase sigma factor [Bryobacteraceae bacterium]
MLDYPEESNALVIGPAAGIGEHSASSIEDSVVALFDELRIPLLRYLSGFPLALSDSEDIIQEAFLALFERVRKGNPHQNVRAWLFRVAHNLALKRQLQFRKASQNSTALTGMEGAVADPNPSPEAQCAANQRQARVLAAVRALPQPDRLCMYLRAEGLRYREIAEILDISLGSVALYLERSLARIARAAEG